MKSGNTPSLDRLAAAGANVIASANQDGALTVDELNPQLRDRLIRADADGYETESEPIPNLTDPLTRMTFRDVAPGPNRIGTLTHRR